MTSRTVVFVLLAMGGLALTSPPAAAEATSSISPSAAAPGVMLHLVFAPGDTGIAGLADVAVQRSVTCTITGPNGTPLASCPGAPTLVTAKISPGATAYAWDLAAPAEPGNYTVTFQETSVLAIPQAAPTSQARFEVLKPVAEPITPATLPPETVKPATSASIFGGFLAVFVTPGALAATHDPLAGARWMLALLVGSAALLTIFFAQRHGGGP